MTVRQVADALGMKVRTIRGWVVLGVLEGEKKGKCWEIPESEIERTEVVERANKGRRHSKRTEDSSAMGVLARRGEDTEMPV